MNRDKSGRQKATLKGRFREEKLEIEDTAGLAFSELRKLINFVNQHDYSGKWYSITADGLSGADDFCPVVTESFFTYAEMRPGLVPARRTLLGIGAGSIPWRLSQEFRFFAQAASAHFDQINAWKSVSNAS